MFVFGAESVHKNVSSFNSTRVYTHLLRIHDAYSVLETKSKDRVGGDETYERCCFAGRLTCYWSIKIALCASFFFLSSSGVKQSLLFLSLRYALEV